MELAQAQREKFDGIVDECCKRHLHLEVQVMHHEPIGVHIVVRSSAFGAVYQLGRSWPASFVRDLQAGMFG